MSGFFLGKLGNLQLMLNGAPGSPLSHAYYVLLVTRILKGVTSIESEEAVASSLLAKNNVYHLT